MPPGENIHNYYRTTVPKNCCARGLIDCAPGLKCLDTPVRLSAMLSSVKPAGLQKKMITMIISFSTILRPGGLENKLKKKIKKKHSGKKNFTCDTRTIYNMELW